MRQWYAENHTPEQSRIGGHDCQRSGGTDHVQPALPEQVQSIEQSQPDPFAMNCSLRAFDSQTARLSYFPLDVSTRNNSAASP